MMSAEMELEMAFLDTDQDESLSSSVVSEQIWMVTTVILMLGLVVVLAQLSHAQDLKDVIKNWDESQVQFMHSAPRESLLRAIADLLREKEDAESITRFADLSESRSTTDPHHPCHRVIVASGLPSDAEAQRMFLFAQTHLAETSAASSLAVELFQSALARVPEAERTLIEFDPTLGTGDSSKSIVRYGQEIIQSRLELWKKHVVLTEISLVERSLSDPEVIARVADGNPLRVRAQILAAFETAGYPLLPGIVD